MAVICARRSYGLCTHHCSSLHSEALAYFVLRTEGIGTEATSVKSHLAVSSFGPALLCVTNRNYEFNEVPTTGSETGKETASPVHEFVEILGILNYVRLSDAAKDASDIREEK